MLKYTLVDSGRQNKLEKFGDYQIIRPCSQALWEPLLDQKIWQQADALFSRDKGNRWTLFTKLPSYWITEIEEVQFKIAPTDFGHLGVFPEHGKLWSWMRERIRRAKRPLNVLNLFAYSGGMTLAAAQAGAQVCHLDASKGMVQWARENADLNRLSSAPIRWIVDDVIKFLNRECKRNASYDGIVLDPPSFGRGNRGEIFKIEKDLPVILQLCRRILSLKPAFVILSSHTPGMTPIAMHHLMAQMMQGIKGIIEMGEMVLSTQGALDVPSGSYARWFDEE